MPLGLIGAAWTYGTTAFSYNMGRFQFDKGQQQNTAHQIQNVRMSLFSLFREDVRDLFGITTSNMSTYTTVGTLFLGFTANMIWNVYANFPEEPPFLCIVYSNCLYSSIAYGALSVWLAMHGTIAAHSASVKVLTQAVRPPIPSAEDVVGVAHNLAKYEGSPSTMLTIPNAFGWREMVQPGPSLPVPEGIPSGPTTVPVPSSPKKDTDQTTRLSTTSGRSVDQRIEVDNAPLRNRGSIASTAARSSTAAVCSTPAKTRTSVGSTAPAGSTAGNDANDDDDDLKKTQAEVLVGGGASALLGEHAHLFRKLQPTYLPYEAYSRVSLLASTHYLLILFTYYLIAHMYGNRSSKTGFSKHPAISSWCAAFVLPFTSLLLFKLDLYVQRFAMRFLKGFLMGGPLLLCLAASLWSWNKARRHKGLPDYVDDRVPQIVGMFGCVLHFVLEIQMLWEARPCGEAKLPTNFRSVQYTDLFGWWFKHNDDDAPLPEYRSAEYVQDGAGASEAPEQQQEQQQPELGSLEASQAARQMGKLARVVNMVLSDELVENLSSDELESLGEIRLTLETHTRSLRQSLDMTSSSNSSMMTPDKMVWLQCTYASDGGQFAPYFVSTTTAEVLWERPPVGHIMDVSAMARTVNDLCRRAEYNSFHRMVSDESVQNVGALGTPMLASPDAPGKQMSATPFPVQSKVRFDAEVELQLIENDPTFDAEFVKRSRFAPMRRRPQSRHDSASMAWKYFLQVGTVVATLWAITVIWIGLYGQHTIDFIVGEVNSTDTMSFVAELDPIKYIGSSSYIAPQRSTRVEPVSVTWPHSPYRPMAWACAGSEIIVGERFVVHTTSNELPFTGLPHLGKFEPVLRAPDITAPWSALAALPGGKQLFLLESEGAAVLEYMTVAPAAQQRGEQRADVPKRWKLASSAGLRLQAIAGVSGAAVVSTCEALGSTKFGWALFGVSDLGEVVSLCPFRGGSGNDSLEPVQVITQLEIGFAVSGISADHEDMLWVFAHSSEAAKVYKFSLDGILRGVWDVPLSRDWALGVCALQGPELLALAVREGPGKTTNPEVWRVTLDSSVTAT